MIHSTFHVYIYGPEGGPLACRFEDIADRLQQVDRLHLELDGSFVWVGPNWQLDGMIYDHNNQVRYIDLKGNCPSQQWTDLRQWIAKPEKTGQSVKLSVWDVHGQVLQDLQSFEAIHWPQSCYGS